MIKTLYRVFYLSFFFMLLMHLRLPIEASFFVCLGAQVIMPLGPSVLLRKCVLFFLSTGLTQVFFKLFYFFANPTASLLLRMQHFIQTKQKFQLGSAFDHTQVFRIGKLGFFLP